MYKLPELLCPAGDMSALEAAIEGGADAVYFGGADFNARKNARNFDTISMREAVKTAHAHGVKAYVTQNTLCYDREMSAFLSAAETAIDAGADALIVADMGGAREIRRLFPKCELHASTQMSGHNLAAAAELEKMGFTRMVIAREASYEDIKFFTQNTQMELEVFVHGALCVCHSGQCLFSSMVGGRSGNRGECAQPCRLPYSGAYPLSLKDSSLAVHIPKLIECGVSSLKIEGRMKSPEYVRDVSRIYRRLLDEKRGATPEEMKELAAVFSRGGFTDGYFTGNVGRSMLGVRSENDKKNSRELVPFEGLAKKVPISLFAQILRGKPCSLTITSGDRQFKYVSEIVAEDALNAPLSYETVKKQLTKTGATAYEVKDFSLELDEGLMLPVSVINRIRREAVEGFEALGEKKTEKADVSELLVPLKKPMKLKTAYYNSPRQLTDKAMKYFDIIFLPLHKYGGETKGVALPPVIFDRERERVEKILECAKAMGAEYALVGNIGHIGLAKKFGLKLYGDIRLNVSNTSSAAFCESLGFEGFIVSPELSLAQARDIGGAKLVTVYGRLPLMLLEKCVGKELGGCDRCGTESVLLVDRRGAKFPVLREWEHRSVVYNSLPTSMSDKTELLSKNGILGQHFIFSVESGEECDRVISAFEQGKELSAQVRRIGSTVTGR